MCPPAFPLSTTHIVQATKKTLRTEAFPSFFLGLSSSKRQKFPFPTFLPLSPRVLTGANTPRPVWVLDQGMLPGYGNGSWICTSQWETPRGKCSQSSPGFVLPGGSTDGGTAGIGSSPAVSVLTPNTHSERRKDQHKALGKRFPGNGVTGILEEMELLARSRAVLCIDLCLGGRKKSPSKEPLLSRQRAAPCFEQSLE